MLGYLNIINFEYDFHNDKTTIIFHKIYNCKIIHNDNSIWSVDCFYPYVVVGGNHRCIFINDINNQLTENNQGLPNEIRNNIILLGNKHNIPYVSFSPEGEFIICNSVDSTIKIWEVESGRLLTIINNDVKEMYLIFF